MINKNKEEIEKMSKNIKRLEEQEQFCIGNVLFHSYMRERKVIENKKQERIKTSILLFEEIKNIYEQMDMGRYKIKEIKTHLTWLKEQEKEL